MDSRQKNKFLTNLIIYLTFFLFWFYIWLKYIDYKAEKVIVDNVKNSEETELNMSKYFHIYELLKKYHYDFDNSKSEDFINSSIVWLTQGLKDPYTEYFTAKEEKDFMESLEWDFEWIWAILEKDELWIKISSILPDSPAEKWDIRAWDIVTNVNWTEIAWMKTQEVIWLIKWPSWKEVNLKIIRNQEIIDKKVFTWKVNIPSINSEDLSEETWYIQISTFWEKTWNEFEESLKKFKNKKWIIIDLRQNSWWYLETAMKLIWHFLKKWEVLAITKYKDWREEKYFSEAKWTFYEWKIVVLIDRYSASASEIFAWAMKDYKKAILVWEKSFWKGSVQQPFPLNDWSMVKITIAKWFTPIWISIDKQWIKPDVEVNFEKEDIEKKYDRQKEEAKKVLEYFIKNDLFQISIDKYLEENKKS